MPESVEMQPEQPAPVARIITDKVATEFMPKRLRAAPPTAAGDQQQ